MINHNISQTLSSSYCLAAVLKSLKKSTADGKSKPKDGSLTKKR